MDRLSVAGLFLSHAWSPRIEKHFARLVRESHGLVTWQVAQEQDGLPCADSQPGEAVLALRLEQMRRNEGVQGGFMDTAIWPPLLARDADFTWIMEYDVDFSGNWAKLFEQFGSNPADLLTTTIVPRSDSADWFWWKSAAAPPNVRPEQMHRAFLPLMRVSRKFAREYARSMADPRWTGHYEFTIPTAAVSAGLLVEDIGGNGPLCPTSRRNRNYRNAPADWRLSPGTFVWRPSRDRYFVEAPEAFPEADMLHHPVKAGVPEWRREFDLTATVAPPWLERLSPGAPTTMSVAMATYNGELYLRQQLESLAKQETLPDELVVCDDCSSDATVGILREFASHAPFSVELIENGENVGYAANFISAAQRCGGDLILFCDQDDVWSPGKVAVVSRTAAASPAQVFSHDVSVFSGEVASPTFPSYFGYLRQLGFPPALCMKGCATAVRAEFIRAWGWPRAGTGVSHDFWIALLATAFGERRYIEQPLVAHRLHAHNASGWIASEGDRVASRRWSAARRARQSDLDLLIELCLKRWNLAWTDEFVRVLDERGADVDGDDASELIDSLERNRSRYASVWTRAKQLMWRSRIRSPSTG